MIVLIRLGSIQTHGQSMMGQSRSGGSRISRGRGANLVGAPTLDTPTFPKNCQNFAKRNNWDPWGRGHVPDAPPWIRQWDNRMFCNQCDVWGVVMWCCSRILGRATEALGQLRPGGELKVYFHRASASDAKLGSIPILASTSASQ